MKINKTKFILSLFCAVLVILIGTFTYLFFNQPISVFNPVKYESTGDAQSTKELSKIEVKEDVKNLINILESTHPLFLEGENEKYNKAKDVLLQDTDKEMKVFELQLAVSKYLSSIEDGHTRIKWTEDKFLNVNWIYYNNKLLLVDENNMVTVKEVTKINNVEIETIISKISELFPAENYSAEILNILNYSKSKLLLNSAGVNASDTVTLTLSNNQGEDTLDVNFINVSNINEPNYEISSKKIDDKTFYLKLGICEVNAALDSAIKDLRSAIDSGATNVIIDVRYNPGGSSMVCSKILDAMKIKPGSFGSIIRFSPLAQKYRGYLRKSGYIKIEGENTSVKNDDINLYVITNESTFSSAQWLATWVKDGKLGTIVGQSSSNMPSSYGDALLFQLENSKLEGQISFKKWTRPDETKDNERALEPDVKVNYGEDPLEKVLELIKQ